MRKIFKHLLFIPGFALTCFTLSAQPGNDDCINAVQLSQTGYCNPISGTTINATESIPAIYCYGTAGSADDDVWFKFVALTTGPTIVVMPAPGFDAVVDLRMGNCNGTNINCADFKGPGGTESIYTGGLLIGTTYYIRVYGFGSGQATQGDFSICVYGAPPIPPINDNCSGALYFEYPGPNLGTTASCTQSAGPVDCDGLTGDADDDVWYQFITSSENQTIQVEGVQNFDPVVDLREGPCLGSTIACADLTANGGFETLKATNLALWSTYYVRVYSYGSGSNSQGEFTLRISESVCPTCPQYDFELSPSIEWRNHSSTIFSGSCNTYRVQITLGNEYTFKTGCGNGATANFDSFLQLYDENCNLYQSDDNYCEENHSQITYEAPYTGYAYLRVTGTSPTAYGSYTLAYHTPYPLENENRQNSREDGVAIFPNPTTGALFLDMKDPSFVKAVTLYDLMGRNLQSNKVGSLLGTRPYFTFHVEPGLYLLGIETNKGITFRKLEIIP